MDYLGGEGGEKSLMATIVAEAQHSGLSQQQLTSGP
jgi:hypothetical protein